MDLTLNTVYKTLVEKSDISLQLINGLAETLVNLAHIQSITLYMIAIGFMTFGVQIFFQGRRIQKLEKELKNAKG